MKKIIGLVVVLLLLTGCAGNMNDGIALLEGGKYEEAVEAFDKAVQKKDSSLLYPFGLPKKSAPLPS